MDSKAKILIIEDELPIRRFLRASLPDSAFDIVEAVTGHEGIRAAATHNPDVILLDLGLPDMDGLEVTKAIREWAKTRIIVISARGQESDKIAALDNGADDYLTKPFGVGELLARIRVALRQSKQSESGAAEAVFSAAGLKVDFSTRQVWARGNEVHLTPIEYKLLSVLIQHAGRVLTHKHLLTEVWGAAYANDTHYLRVFMGQLRHKLEENPAKPVQLITEPGVGYRFRIADGE